MGTVIILANNPLINNRSWNIKFNLKWLQEQKNANMNQKADKFYVTTLAE